MENATFPDSITAIGESAFEKCSKLGTVTIPGYVEKIGHFAFCFFLFLFRKCDSTGMKSAKNFMAR